MGLGGPPGAAAVSAVKAKEESEPLFLWAGHFNVSPIYPEPHGLLLWLMVHLGLLGGRTAAHTHTHTPDWENLLMI